MISPILAYNSEIWSVYTKPEFKAWDSSQIEKTYLQFCKRYLEVNNKASNIACRAELGRFPLNIAINLHLPKVDCDVPESATKSRKRATKSRVDLFHLHEIEFNLHIVGAKIWE